jgi:hypothetical protein
MVVWRELIFVCRAARDTAGSARYLQQAMGFRVRRRGLDCMGPNSGCCVSSKVGSMFAPSAYCLTVLRLPLRPGPAWQTYIAKVWLLPFPSAATAPRTAALVYAEPLALP